MFDNGRPAPGTYGQDFSAMPRVVQSKQKFKDPYSHSQKE